MKNIKLPFSNKQILALLIIAILIALGFTFATKAESVELNWHMKDTNSVVGYNIKYGNIQSDIVVIKKIGNVNKYLITDLQPGRIYSFTVNAYDKNGNSLPESNVLRIKIPNRNIVTNTSIPVLTGRISNMYTN